MPPGTEQAYNLVDRGGALALLFLAVIFVFTAFMWGWVVPGWLYAKAEKREEDALALVKALTEGFKGLTEEVREMRRDSAGRVGRGSR